jgi:hypothetical protein
LALQGRWPCHLCVVPHQLSDGSVSDHPLQMKERVDVSPWSRFRQSCGLWVRFAGRGTVGGVLSLLVTSVHTDVLRDGKASRLPHRVAERVDLPALIEV